MTVVPAETTAAEVMALAPDGVFLSNGPGDPEPCTYAIDATREFLANGTPLFGICLGHQILGLAVGAKTVKMKFGHHGANHPVLELETGRVMITSQNHGFAVDETTLPAERQGHAQVAVRRLAAGHQLHGPTGVQLPGPPRGQPGSARPGPAVRAVRRIDACARRAPRPMRKTV